MCIITFGSFFQVYADSNEITEETISSSVSEESFEQIFPNLTEQNFVSAAEQIESRLDLDSLSEDEKNQIVIEYLVANSYVSQARAATMPPTKYGGLNASEVKLAKKHPFEATQYYAASNVAKNYTVQKFNRNGFQDASDAFRHAMWNGNLTQRIKANRAKVWTDAHEAYSSGVDKQMDLFNNNLGRTIGVKYGSHSNGINVKNMSDAIYKAVKAGQGKVIKGGKLVSSKF